MKNIRSRIVSVALVFSFIGVNAQKYTEGDKTLSFLAGETTVNLEYDYENMIVGKKPEAEYVKGKVEDYNFKEPGRGDRWKIRWFDNRSAIFEPIFEVSINDFLLRYKTNITAGKNKTAGKYTLIIRTVWTEPGYNTVVANKDAYCKFEFIWMETATKKMMAKSKLKKVVGVPRYGDDFNNFDAANRIQECYASAGNVVGSTIGKALKKK